MSDLTFAALMALVLAGPAVMLARGLRRRAALRQFAARQGLRFRGILPSDKCAPYTSFGIVRNAVLLSGVVEGRWKGVDVAVFDFPRRSGRTCTGVIMSIADDGSSFLAVPPDTPGVHTMATGLLEDWTRAAGLGLRTAARLRSAPHVVLMTDAGHLFLSPMRRLAADALPEFLEFASSVARDLDADAASLRQIPL